MIKQASEKIEAFLALLDAQYRDPTSYESYYAMRAITAFAQGYDSLAEADIDRASRPPRPPTFGKGRRARLPEITSLPFTREQLRRHWQTLKLRAGVAV